MPKPLPAELRQTYRLIALVTGDVHKRVQKAADDLGLSLGEYVRRKVLDEPLPKRVRR